MVGKTFLIRLMPDSRAVYNLVSENEKILSYGHLAIDKILLPVTLKNQHKKLRKRYIKIILIPQPLIYHDHASLRNWLCCVFLSLVRV